MNKKTILLAAFVFAVLGMNAQTTTTDEGVVINGVKWATRNVDAPGTFAANPEDAGMFYQWSRNRGWSATDPMIDSNGGTTWYSFTPPPAGTTWTTDNNVCPFGWRIPTDAEIQSLITSGSQWITQNGVNGRIFGSGDNTIFLPIAGYRSYTGGVLNGASSLGSYWSSTRYGSSNAYYLYFHSDDAYVYHNSCIMGFSVRCVEDENPIPNSLESVSADTEKNIVAYYSITGQKLKQEPEKGIYIVVYDNGTSEKIVK